MPFYNFESGLVRRLVLTPEGVTLRVLSSADGRVDVFNANTHASMGSVFTGLEPISMTFNPAVRNELWVANQLSDSVAIVDLTALVVKETWPHVALDTHDKNFKLNDVLKNPTELCVRRNFLCGSFTLGPGERIPQTACDQV